MKLLTASLILGGLLSHLIAATSLDISQGPINITEPGEYVVSGSSDTERISVKTTGSVILRIQGLRITLANTGCALDFVRGEVHLQLQDSSVLNTGNTAICTGNANLFIEDYVDPDNDDGKIGVVVGTSRYGHGVSGSFTMRGGKLIATGGSSSAGISPYYKPAMVVEGGYVVAYGGSYAAGIGGDENMPAGALIVTGGSVKAVSGGWAAAIGGGGASVGKPGGAGSNLTISGGDVVAIGSGRSATIGGGETCLGCYKGGFENLMPSGDIVISGGTLTTDGEGSVVGTPTDTINNIRYTGTVSITGGSIVNLNNNKNLYQRLHSEVMPGRTNGKDTVYRFTIQGCAPNVVLDSAYFSSSPDYGIHGLRANSRGEISVFLPVGKVSGLVKVMGHEYSFADSIVATDSNEINVAQATKLKLLRNGSEMKPYTGGAFRWVDGDQVIPVSEALSASLPPGHWVLYAGDTSRQFSTGGIGSLVEFELYYNTLAFIARPGIVIDSQLVYKGQNGWTTWGYATQPNVADSADCTFLGWFIDASFTKVWNFLVDQVTKPTTLYGKFSPQCPAHSSSSTSSSSGTSSSSSSSSSSSTTTAIVRNPQSIQQQPLLQRYDLRGKRIPSDRIKL